MVDNYLYTLVRLFEIFCEVFHKYRADPKIRSSLEKNDTFVEMGR